jgi:UDP-glucose 6-dehydrogenase
VPTPIDETRQPDLRNVMAAVDGISDVLRPGNHVIAVSTCPSDQPRLLRKDSSAAGLDDRDRGRRERVVRDAAKESSI